MLHISNDVFNLLSIIHRAMLQQDTTFLVKLDANAMQGKMIFPKISISFFYLQQHHLIRFEFEILPFFNKKIFDIFHTLFIIDN